MRDLETFISKEFRPDIQGGVLDKKHKTRLCLDLTSNDIKSNTMHANAICFGPRNDNVLINIEHAARKDDHILTMYYEDMHIRWSYISDSSGDFFIYKKNDKDQVVIKPTYLYIRGCYIEPEDEFWYKLGAFFSFVDMWDGKVLCAPSKQLTNESKLFQLNNSLINASKKYEKVSIGKSYVVKGLNNFNSIKENSSFIVKSLSGVRSIVVDEKNYGKWDTKKINSIPVLFQEKVRGYDLRAHVLKNEYYAKKSNSKDNVDYRYDKEFFNLSNVDFLDEEVSSFCMDVAKNEDNDLLGIDFIKTETGYVVLEANPSPGWSAYHPFDGITINSFIYKLISVFKND